MTTNKDLKRLVRDRMRKTGESYTAARAQIIREPDSTLSKGDAIAPADYAKLAGMSDAVVKEKTGRTWQTWVKALDHEHARDLSHREMARLIRDKWHTGPWWTQMVAVGYERIKGLRAQGQGRDGSYEATKSRTFNVGVETLFDAWAKPARRKQWLHTPVKVRTATSPKSIRLDWPSGGIVAVGFFRKGKAKSSVAISHAKLGDRATVAQVKAEWGERFDVLADMLAED